MALPAPFAGWLRPLRPFPPEPRGVLCFSGLFEKGPNLQDSPDNPDHVNRPVCVIKDNT